MTTTSTFGVVGMDGTPLNRRQGIFNKTGFIQCVGMNRDLDIHGFGNSQAVINRSRRGAPVLVKLQADGAGLNLFLQRQ